MFWLARVICRLTEQTELNFSLQLDNRVTGKSIPISGIFDRFGARFGEFRKKSGATTRWTFLSLVSAFVYVLWSATRIRGVATRGTA